MFTACFTIFVSSFIIALSGAMMPGPLLTVTIGDSSRRGMGNIICRRKFPLYCF